MTTAEIFVLFYSQEGIKNTLTFVVKVLIILLVSKLTIHNPYFFYKFYFLYTNRLQCSQVITPTSLILEIATIGSSIRHLPQKFVPSRGTTTGKILSFLRFLYSAKNT